MRGKLKKLLKKQTRESLMLSVVLYGTKTVTMPEEGRYQTIEGFQDVDMAKDGDSAAGWNGGQMKTYYKRRTTHSSLILQLQKPTEKMAGHIMKGGSHAWHLRAVIEGRMDREKARGKEDRS